jgi:hypothetical protein
MSHLRLCCFGLLLFASLLCHSCSSSELTTKIDSLDPFVKFVESAEAVSVRMGIGREGKTNSRATVRLHAFDFYKEKLTISDDVGEKLSKWFNDPGTFDDWDGEKKCGGFHPDYAIEWMNGSESVMVLFCLSCHEIKAYLGNRAVRLNVKKKAYDYVKELLAISQYRDDKNGKGE